MVTEQQIVDALQQDTDFFDRQSDLLRTLRLPCLLNEKTVSLAAFQAQFLRRQNEQLEEQRAALLRQGQRNDHILQQIHRLTCRLFACATVDEVMQAVRQALRDDFKIDPVLCYLSDPVCHAVVADVPASLCQVFSEVSKPLCGAPKNLPLGMIAWQYVCPNVVIEGSLVYLPLDLETPQRTVRLGMLVFADQDPQRFSADSQTIYLVRLSQVIACAIWRYCAQS